MRLEALERGSIVLVAFPFTDLTATKVRPALVLSQRDFHRRHRDVILAAISSVPRARPTPTAVVIGAGTPDFAATHLRTTSTVDCGKIVTVMGTLVLKHLGALSSALMARVDKALIRAVGLS